jgi:DNA-binding transcriptional LysR family regulator
MNSLDALAATAKEGAGIVRVPSWQAQAGLGRRPPGAALAGYEPAPVPLHLMFQPSRLASPKIRALVDDLVERLRGVDSLGAPPCVDR